MGTVRNLMRVFTQAKEVRYLSIYRRQEQTNHPPHYLRRKMDAKIRPPVIFPKMVSRRVGFLRPKARICPEILVKNQIGILTARG